MTWLAPNGSAADELTTVVTVAQRQPIDDSDYI